MALVIQFLGQVHNHVRAGSGDLLRAWLQVEPSAPQSYHELAAQLRTQFRPDNNTKLFSIVESCLPEDDNVPEGGASPWPGFATFIREYLLFWRDVNTADAMGTYHRLSSLVNTCSTAFTHPTYGWLLLQTCMSLSESLCRFTMVLSKNPAMAARNQKRSGNGDESRKSVAESSAEILQKIFTTCLTDRSSGRNGKPTGKKVGVYMFANLVLKLLFACKKTHLAKQIFTNISTNSPPLSLYPASQRVTFLYYLGRFHFSHNHFPWASRCLQEAYRQTPPPLVSHRMRIMTYLIPSNMLLGVLPSSSLFARPDVAPTLAPVYGPMSIAIKTGNFELLQQTLHTHRHWLLERALMLTLVYRLRPLVWRSLARKTFILTYVPDPDVLSRKAATLDLDHLLTVAQHIQRCMEGWVPARSLPQVPADYASWPTTLCPPPEPKKLSPSEGLVSGNLAVTASSVEGVIQTLITQGLMHGFIAHASQKFAIKGSKQKGSPLVAGWPLPCVAIQERRYDEDVDWERVPGWVTA